MIPKRGTYRGQSYKLYEDYNDTQIFVEDLGFENLYIEIFRRYGLHIRKIFAIGGKIDVIKTAIRCENPKCFFLIDRDWDDIIKKDWNKTIGNCVAHTPTKTLNNILDIERIYKNIIVTERHSIENYLLDYSGFFAIILADNPKENIDNLISRDIFGAMVSEVAAALRPLFECFLAMQIEGKKKNCSCKPGCFQNPNNSGLPNDKKIKEFVSDSNVMVSQEINNYFSVNPIERIGHGKYMLHFIWETVRRRYKLPQLKIEKLMLRLAQVVNTEVFDDFCKKIV